MDIERVLSLASTVKFQMDALKRKVQSKPGHQNVTPLALVMAAQHDLAEIELELTR